MTKTIGFLAMIASLLTAPQNAHASDDFPAFSAVTGSELKTGDALVLAETATPYVYDLVQYKYPSSFPIIDDDWEVIGTVWIDQYFELEEDSGVAGSNTIQLEDESTSSIEWAGTSGAVGATIELKNSTILYVSAFVASTAMTVEDCEGVCGSFVCILPVNTYASSDLAKAGAAELASNGASDPGEPTGVMDDEECFAAATSEEDCDECHLQCYRRAWARRHVCRAGCSPPSEGWILGGGSVGAAAVGVCIGGGPFGCLLVAGAAVGGTAGAIYSDWSCRRRCHNIHQAERDVCDWQYAGCLLH